MKAVSVFVLGIFSVISLAADPPTYKISCGVKKHETQGSYSIGAAVKGLVTGRSGKPYTLEDYSVGYTVYDQEGEVWANEEIKGQSLDYNANYKPRKYLGHVQFSLPSELGKVELIYPASLEKKTRFEAHLVFTYIKDHFGGSAKVYCSRKKVN